jgi:hypothetical protein
MKRRLAYRHNAIRRSGRISPRPETCPGSPGPFRCNLNQRPSHDDRTYGQEDMDIDRRLSAHQGLPIRLAAVPGRCTGHRAVPRRVSCILKSSCHGVRHCGALAGHLFTSACSRTQTLAAPCGHHVPVSAPLSCLRLGQRRHDAQGSRRGPHRCASAFTPYGIEANRHNIEVLINYMYTIGMIPRRFAVDELFNNVTRTLA